VAAGEGSELRQSRQDLVVLEHAQSMFVHVTIVASTKWATLAPYEVMPPSTMNSEPVE
jgi:hypothetical protein